MTIQQPIPALDLASRCGEAVVIAPPAPLERRRLQCYLALMLGDLVALFLGFSVPGYLYLGAGGLESAGTLAQLIAPVFVTIAMYNSAYSMSALARAGYGILRALVALAVAGIALVSIAFFTKSSGGLSRLEVIASLAGSAMAIVWMRLQLRSFVLWRCGGRVINELVIEDGGPAVHLDGAYRVSARLAGLVPATSDPAALDRIGMMLRGMDRVVVSCPPDRRVMWTTILKGASIAGEVIDPVVQELGARGARVAGGQGLLAISVGAMGMRARALKRGFDLVLAGGALLLLAPLLAAVAIAIRLEDGGPVLFAQQRVGRGNRFFTIWKFRSMRAEASDSDGTVSASREDRRITRIGRLIRRTSIDELPQLFNVLIGDMSLVGPRPHALGSQAGAKLFWEVDTRYWHRHVLKPGLTGLAQIRGLRGATEFEDDLIERLDADLEYLNGWSLWRDIAILAQTVRVLVHHRAY